MAATTAWPVGLASTSLLAGPVPMCSCSPRPANSAAGQSGIINNGSYSASGGQGLRDVITDFTHGQDRIDLSAIDANSKIAGNQAFSWRGTGNFTGAPGQLIERIYNPAGTANDKTIIYGDINGDARADFQIELTGLKTITVSDFIL